MRCRAHLAVRRSCSTSSKRRPYAFIEGHPRPDSTAVIAASWAAYLMPKGARGLTSHRVSMRPGEHSIWPLHGVVHSFSGEPKSASTKRTAEQKSLAATRQRQRCMESCEHPLGQVRRHSEVPRTSSQPKQLRRRRDPHSSVTSRNHPGELVPHSLPLQSHDDGSRLQAVRYRG